MMINTTIMKPMPAAEVISRYTCDEVLWIDFRKGDKDAFALLYYRYFKILIQSAVAISDDRDLIKDCIHDLFMEIWKNKLKLGIPQSVKAYLVRSLQRKIIRQVKKARTHLKKYSKEVNNDGEIVNSIEKQIISQQLQEEQKKKVINVLQTLTKRQKEAVYLKFYANLSYPEIAGKMSISTDSIYNLISKAIDNMQHKFFQTPKPVF